MEFLAPFFAVAGITAAGIPLVLHLLRRTPTERLPFSLVRFLNPGQPKLTRRSTIEHWPLLLLRILALVLLGLAFARPFQRSDTAVSTDDQQGKNIALLIDRSASMRRGGLKEQVIQEVQTITANLQDSDRLRVILFSNTAETAVSFESWAAASSGERSNIIDQLCEEYTADWHATRTGLALQQTADDLIQHGQAVDDHEIILVTDFQEGSDFGPVLSGDWPRSVRVSLRKVTPQHSGNASLHTMQDRRSGKLLVRIRNDVDATTTQFTLQPRNREGLTAGPEIAVEAIPGRQTTLPLISMDLSADATSLSLTGDANQFDNLISLPEQNPRTSQIAHAGSTNVNDAESMRYYLQRALDGMTNIGEQSTESPVQVFDAVTAEGHVLPVGDRIKLAILTEPVPTELLPSLKAVLTRGGIVVAALRSPAMAQSLASLLPEGVAVSEAAISDYAMFGRIDYEHPLFAGFSDARFADFSSIRFWKHREITLTPPDDTGNDGPAPWTVVARFDSGLPAIVRLRSSDNGEIYLLASGWHPDDSQWALSSRFAPMLAGFLDLARPATSEYRRVLTGDSFDPVRQSGSSQGTLQWPDGTQQSFAEEEGDAEQTARISVDQPGRYTLRGTSEAGETMVTLLAEIPPAESRTTPLPDGQLYAMGLARDHAPLASDDATTDDSNSVQASAEQLEAEQDYWRWFLLAGLACLVTEALMATAIQHRQPETV